MQPLKETITGNEPITVSEAKNYLKVDFTTDDTLIGLIITSVREQAERYTGLALIAKTLELFDEEIPETIKLPYPEHSEVTEVKLNGVATTGYYKTGLTQYILSFTDITTTTANDYGLYVKYKCSGTCPTGLKALMLKEIDEAYRNRGNTFEGSIQALSNNFYASAAKYCLM